MSRPLSLDKVIRGDSRGADSEGMTVDTRLLQRWTHERRARLAGRSPVAGAAADGSAARVYDDEFDTLHEVRDEQSERQRVVLHLVTEDR